MESEQKKAERRQLLEEERIRKQQKKEEHQLQKQLNQAEYPRKPVRENTQSEIRRKKKSEELEEKQDFLPVTWASSYLPIEKIKDGIIYTADHRYVKIVEVLPINFLLRSPSEQRNVVFSFLSYLKIAPVKLQFKVISKKADISEYLEKIQQEIEAEEDEQCRVLQEDYARLIRSIGTKEAITRRFFLIFEFQSYDGNRKPKEKEVYQYMRTTVQTAKNIWRYVAM